MDLPLCIAVFLSMLTSKSLSGFTPRTNRILSQNVEYAQAATEIQLAANLAYLSTGKLGEWSRHYSN